MSTVTSSDRQTVPRTQGLFFLTKEQNPFWNFGIGRKWFWYVGHGPTGKFLLRSYTKSEAVTHAQELFAKMPATAWKSANVNALARNCERSGAADFVREVAKPMI